jgi:hypothetical protein
MAQGRSIEPEDLIRAAAIVTAALAPAVGRDWSVKAGRLDWDVDRTITHMAGGTAKHTLYLASRSTRFIAVNPGRWHDASQAEQLEAITGVCAAMASVAASTPSEARAYHATGMCDAEGYLAMDCIDLLVHCHDVAEGLGMTYTPPDDLCQALVARSFPWFAETDDAWRSMLRHTHRVGPPRDDSWTMLTTPRAEWDGAIPRRDPRPVVEWIREGARWRPRYFAGR